MLRHLLLLLVWARATASGKEKINVALHAQSNYATYGWVAGSEVTTSGLRRAFEALACVRTCEVFAPFSYSGLSSRKWDLVVVEGFTGSVPAFIHEVRAGNANAVVLFYCLDTYPSLSVVGNLDVDAFLTNSRLLLPFVQKIAPASSLIHLAADPSVMLEVPFHPDYGHNVVYLGQFKDTKHRLAETLKEVAPFGLAIYGNGWDRVGAEELLPFWRGVLPLKDIASLYSSAKVVLSTTETLQRGLGMVNNRVFEALACGCAVVSDAFPEMEKTFGDHILYYRHPGDAARAVEFLLGNDTARAELGRRGRKLVLSKHTYASRVQSVLSTMGDVLSSRAREPSDAGADAGGGGAGAPRGPEASGGDAGASRAGIVAAVAEVEVPGATSRAHPKRGRFGSGANLAAVVPARSLESCTTPWTAAKFFSGEGKGKLQSDGFPAAAVSPSGKFHVEERRPGGCLGSDGDLPLPPAINKTIPESAKEQHLRAAALVQLAGDVDGPPEEAQGACDRLLDGSTLPSLPPSQASSSSKPFAGCTRPNAPTILVVYRSGCPLPVRVRRDLEAAVDRTAGGARMGFVRVGEAVRGGGKGSEVGGVSRLKSLEAGLSRLLAAADAGADTSALKLLGDEAASKAAGFMECCCSVGMVVVYAKVGDPLERHFLHPLAEETVHRAVRTAFFVASPGGSGAGRADGCGTPRDRSSDSSADQRRTDRYEWVQRFSDAFDTEETAQPESFSNGAVTGSEERARSDGVAFDKQIEKVLFGISRQAAIHVKEPRDGALLAVRQRQGEGAGDWAEVDLVVEVEHPFFRAPDDGMWCVLLDDMEVGCRGDHDPQEARFTGSRHSLAITVHVVPLAVPRRVNLQAVLMGGPLESVRVMRKSAPVSVTLWPFSGRAHRKVVSIHAGV